MSAPAGAARSQPAQAPLWRSRFEQGLADWGPLQADWGQPNLRWVYEPALPGRVLRVLLQRGGIDPASMRARGLPRSGAGWRAALLQRPRGSHGQHAATLHYRLRFAPGFDFARGGKLPGLYGGNAPSGGHIPNGHDGFSLRLMWLAGGQGEVYAYLPDSRRHGSSLLSGHWRFQPGQWHRVVQQVWLNTPGRADGGLRMAVDGRWVGQVDGLRLRDSCGLRLDGVFFDLFHGGNDDSWAPAVDSHVDLADFALWPGADTGPAGARA